MKSYDIALFDSLVELFQHFLYIQEHSIFLIPKSVYQSAVTAYMQQ